MQPAENHRIDKEARSLGGGQRRRRRPVAALCIGNPKMLPNSRSKISVTEDLDHEDQ
jgi:hypothetical protein